MDALNILVLLVLFLFAIAVVLFYSTKNAPAKKLNIDPPTPSDTEFSRELTPQSASSVQETIPDPPQGYNQDQLALMVRDPNWVHLYWEITERHRNEIEQLHGNWFDAVPVLRVYNAAGMEKLFDVTINDEASSWYLNVPDNTHLIVDLVRVYPSGEDVTVLRSNPACTPRAFMSDVIDEDWMLVDENQRKLYRRVGVGPGPSSPDFYFPRKD